MGHNCGNLRLNPFYFLCSPQVTDVVVTECLVVSCSQDATVRLWRGDSPACIRVIHNKLHVLSVSVTQTLLVIKDRSNSIYLLSLQECVAADLPAVLQTNSPHLPGLVLRNLQTYASGGEILNVKALISGNGWTFQNSTLTFLSYVRCTF